MASRAVGSATPSPPPSIHTPPAPRLGFPDSWEPYSPRKSARISSQRTANRTPSPRASHSRIASPRISKRANAQTNAAMVSPIPSPRKKPHPAPGASRQPSGTLTAEGTANAAAALGLNDAKAPQKASVSRATGMLPTPSKTPQKPPNEKTAANIQSFARNLFAPEEEAMPAPRKRRSKKYSGMTMESFTAEENENSIEIFTDSQDRVPVKDQSVENPFYGDVPAPGTRKSKRRLINIPGEGALSIEEASRREDGMVYVFRGKKFFREFSKNNSAQAEEQEMSGASLEYRLTRPLTRSSVKPRLLFPRHQPDEHDDDEALTDVEDTSVANEPANPQTPKKSHSTSAKTPEAPRFAPVSPPDTKRTTRSTNKLAHDGTPFKSSSGRRSPFDAWPRTKELKSPSASKRHGESLASSTTKRSRA
ncbi:hypothetical protein HRG_010379 [Hirsutella rhossiliensis]|uniref:Uncharacterized protein n=1 Tax=Hirsutella rhossiliensis TaxID=111463 RepID=A0A9P8MT32_9HYPO|nr:uncharacterized protein HRG_10379 [Hirsutella rhossiliensis]KAH0958692.1 hypothetical protein HRG_10379 [Hirsutella rhossiliensis]